jgi:acetyl-CoA carboxylase biotin carboxylase subunit
VALAVTKIFIDNRGEIALRILRTCVRLDIGAVVAYSTRDVHSLAVREALRLAETDTRYGAALIGGDLARDSYEDIDGVIASAKAYGCDAVHPGYGFLSERADATEQIAHAGLLFLGPTAIVMSRVGNKAAARELARECSVPLMPASGLLHRFEETTAQAERIGYPLVLKADIGGGGLNNLFVTSPAELSKAFENFSLRNPGGFYLEKKLELARHIELQIVADTHGNVLVLGERDCSAQRKAQKVLEEAPVSVAPEPTLQKMRDAAITMAKSVNYSGVGTWEFLYDRVHDRFYFMEINPRIQVEHTVTEERYDGIDIVEWQIRIARGETLPTPPRLRANHVIQVRLYAENPNDGFKATPGRLAILRLPQPSPTLRIDTGYQEGHDLPPGLDPTIAKLIISAPTRAEALMAVREALEQVMVSGVTSNRDFLLWLVGTPEVMDDTHSTTFIEDSWAHERRARFTDLERFIGDGEFAQTKQTPSFDIERYGHDLSYTRRGRDRRYSEDLALAHSDHRDTCAFSYGTYTAQGGERLMLGIWDFSYMGGTLGSEEGSAVCAMFEAAAHEGLPVVMITSSSGARQQEGSVALEMMDTMVAARFRYRPPLFITLYSGLNFGGVTVSLAESADCTLAVDGSLIGFAGPDLVARMMGKDIGRELPEGAHSSADHYANRTLDLIVGSLDEGRERILDLIASSTMVPRAVDRPLTWFSGIVPTPRYDRPASQRFATLMAGLSPSNLITPRITNTVKPASIDERRAVVADAARPAASDLLDPALGLFDSAAALSLREIKEDCEQFPPIIAAFVAIGGYRAMLLAQQTQRRRNDGTVEKVYVAPRAADFRWARSKVESANRLKLPIILFGDTTGGDASLAEEANGVSRAIAEFLGVFYEAGRITVPVISVNLGENGSGGGLTFVRPMDASADLANALTFVATPDAQVKIITGEWANSATEIATITGQLEDSTSEGRLRLGLIDEIIDESDIPRNLRTFLLRQLTELTALEPDVLISRRFERVMRGGGAALHTTD